MANKLQLFIFRYFWKGLAIPFVGYQMAVSENAYDAGAIVSKGLNARRGWLKLGLAPTISDTPYYTGYRCIRAIPLETEFNLSMTLRTIQ